MKNSYRYYGNKRYRDHNDAYRLDGGANDEGYYMKHCSVCNAKTEHERGDCLSCWDSSMKWKGKPSER